MSLAYTDTSVEKAGLIQTCEANIFGDNGYTQISGNASRLAIFTNYFNEAYSRYAYIAMSSDGTWQFDDTNYTTVPIATANLVSGQQDYGLNTTYIQILGIEIKDSAGNWRAVNPIDELEFSRNGASLSAYYDNAGTAITGIPNQYNQIGASVFLYPTPNYNSTGGLKIRFQRPPSYFLTTETTKAPGFTDLHHTYLTDYATWKYSLNRTISDKADYGALVQIWEQQTIPGFYGGRNKIETKSLTDYTADNPNYL